MFYNFILFLCTCTFIFISLLQFQTNGSMNVVKNSQDRVVLRLMQIKTDM
jgi:hypothetical protein